MNINNKIPTFHINFNTNENVSNKKLNLKNLDLSNYKQMADGSMISKDTLRQNAAEREPLISLIIAPIG